MLSYVLKVKKRIFNENGILKGVEKSAPGKIENSLAHLLCFYFPDSSLVWQNFFIRQM